MRDLHTERDVGPSDPQGSGVSDDGSSGTTQLLLDASELAGDSAYFELGLTAVPDWYGELTALRTLDLGHNRLTRVPDLRALTRLEIPFEVDEVDVAGADGTDGRVDGFERGAQLCDAEIGDSGGAEELDH